MESYNAGSEFYKKKKIWKLNTKRELNGELASINNNRECKQAFTVKSDHLHTDDSKKFPRSSSRNRTVYRSNKNLENNRSNSETHNVAESSKIEQKPSENFSAGFCPDLSTETRVFVNRKYYESNHQPHMDSLTPHQLGQNNHAFLEPYPVDNCMNAQLHQVPLALLPSKAMDESLKEYWWGIDEWNCNNNNWKEGLHADYIQDIVALLDVAEQRLQHGCKRFSPEELRVADGSLEEFYRGAHVAPHSTEENLFPRSSLDDEVDGWRMTSRDLEAATRRHAEGLRRMLRELLLRDEVERVSMIKRQCTAINYPMQYSDCDLLPTRDVTQPPTASSTQLTLDVFVAGSYNVGHVAD